MPVSINNPEHWRARAAEARGLADALIDAEAKRAMVKIATDYERLALRAEQREQAGRTPEQRPAA
jgi:hypothetical protein